MDCTACNGPIDWRKIDGRWQCFNAGTDVIHWDGCAQRRWGQVKATGTRFVRADHSGYRDSIHGTKLDWQRSKAIRGSRYRPVDCRCGVPPWEWCMHSFEVRS